MSGTVRSMRRTRGLRAIGYCIAREPAEAPGDRNPGDRQGKRDHRRPRDSRNAHSIPVPCKRRAAERSITARERPWEPAPPRPRGAVPVSP